MSTEQTIQRIQHELNQTFAQLDTFFGLPEDLRQFQPAPDTWSIDLILEHITLTNHFLMITLKQSLQKVLRRAQNQATPDIPSRLDRIIEIGDPDAFAWERPEHMQPTGNISSIEVRKKLQEQQAECLAILAQIQQGEGRLHRVRMSVQGLGKLDMYEWLYFLVRHAYRHRVEIERICEIYQGTTT